MISCVDDGCLGGDHFNVYHYATRYENFLVDETCSIYQAKGWQEGVECSPMTHCRTCESDEACTIPDYYYTFKGAYYGEVTGMQNMIQEIVKRGPISCGVAVPQSFEDFQGDGVYCDDTGDKTVSHAVSVVGYGKDAND